MNDYFCGWYYKCQSEKDTLAVIPALHRTGGKTTCSIQLITEAASWSVPFPGSAFREDGGQVAIGENRAPDTPRRRKAAAAAGLPRAGDALRCGGYNVLPCLKSSLRSSCLPHGYGGRKSPFRSPAAVRTHGRPPERRRAFDKTGPLRTGTVPRDHPAYTPRHPGRLDKCTSYHLAASVCGGQPVREKRT